MPLQGSYDVNCMEGGDTPRRTSLFTGSCMLRLIGFFVFCILVLIVCLVRWGPSDQPQTEKLGRIVVALDVNGNTSSSTTPPPDTTNTSKIPPLVTDKTTPTPTPTPTTTPPPDTTKTSKTSPLVTDETTPTPTLTPTPTTTPPPDTTKTSKTSPLVTDETTPTPILTPTPTTTPPPDTTKTSKTSPLVTDETTPTPTLTPTPTTTPPPDTTKTSKTSPLVTDKTTPTPTPTPTTTPPPDTTNTSKTPTLVTDESTPTPTTPTTTAPPDTSNTSKTPPLVTNETTPTPTPTTTPPPDTTNTSKTSPLVTDKTTPTATSTPTTTPPPDTTNTSTTPPLVTDETTPTPTLTPTPRTTPPPDTTNTSKTSPLVTDKTTPTATSTPTTTPPPDTTNTSTTPPLVTDETTPTPTLTPTPRTTPPPDTTNTSKTSPLVTDKTTPTPTPTPTTTPPPDTTNTSKTSPLVTDQTTSTPTPTPTTTTPPDTTNISKISPLVTDGTTPTSTLTPTPTTTPPPDTTNTSKTSSLVTDETTSTRLITSRSSLGNRDTSTHGGFHSKFSSQVASEMLSYINHLADACEDFYEHACGRFETNHLLTENDLAKQATQRIFDQAKMNSTSGQGTDFRDYYQSCVTYNKNSTESERIAFAKKAIGEIGKFYRVDEWKDEYFNLTTMLSKLFLRNSAPLFDITADIAVNDQVQCTDTGRATKFSWKLGPPVLESNSYRDKKEHDCYNVLRSAMLEKQVDLRELYENYTNCKNNLENFLDSVQEAMKLSGLSDDDIEAARYEVEMHVMKVFYRPYPDSKDKSQNNPTEGEIRHAYLTKNYRMMKIEELQSKLPADDLLLDWKQLLTTLKGSPMDSEQPVQVYFPDVILKGLIKFSKLSEIRHLHNALLGLYAHKIYYEFVLPPPDVETHCKRVATNLMGTHASSLYMSSFSSQELADMKETVTGVFGDLKRTLESGLVNASWLQQTKEKEIVTKNRDLTIEIPDVSYYQNNQKLNPESSWAKKNLHLTGNFFDDTMMLQKNYRKSIYEVLDKSPSDYDQIWTHFGLPYQTTGSAIYGLNKIVMPYGAIDWSVVWNAKKISSHHLVLATLGTRIAELIAHHFDSTGIQYDTGRRHKENFPVFCSNEIGAVDTYREYVDETKLFFEGFKKIFLSSTKQDVSYTMTDLSLDERLSATTGLQLAYDTMSLLPSESKKLLPWLTNEPETDEKQQFFLAYAQMYCTKVPLTSSFVSLNEKEHLPNRLRVLAAASGNKVLVDTYKCGIGSNVLPEIVPSHFPHLEIVEADDGQQTEEY